MTRAKMLGVGLGVITAFAPLKMFAQSVINNSMCSWYRDSALSAAKAMIDGDLVHNPRGGPDVSNDVLHGRPAPTRNPGCPKGGDRYSKNFIVHATWCAAVDNIDKLADEAVARLQEINGCWKDRSSMCVAYANDALRAQGTNAGHGISGTGASCRYSGARYTASYDENYNYCMSAPLDAVYAEERGRFTDMDRCNRCQEYATTAHNALMKANGKHCKNISGPRWSANPQDHVNWCMNANLSSARAAENDRNHEAEYCTP